MKKLLITTFAFLLLVSFANAEINYKDNNKREDNRDRKVYTRENEDRENNDRDEMYNTIKSVWGDMSQKDLNLYTGKTGSSTLDAQIKALRESYAVKLKALQSQYIVDLQKLVGTTTSLKVLPDQASATATAAVNKVHPNDDNVKQIKKGFFAKLKYWLGLDK